MVEREQGQDRPRPRGPVTAELVIDAAAALTASHGLAGWSLRDLGRALGIAPSVIYHHVGGKELLSRSVARRAFAEIPVPAAEEWRAWFRELLRGIYPALVAYPGVAKWLMMHGPAFPEAMPVMERGLELLSRGGFAGREGLAYSILLNNAVLSVSIADDRRAHEGDGPRDHERMMHEFRELGAGRPGLAPLVEGMMAPLAGDPGAAAEVRRGYYDTLVEVTIAGLEGWRDAQIGAP